MAKQGHVEQGLERVQELLQTVEELADAGLREQVREIVRGVLDFHGAALTRVLEILRQDASPQLVERLATDKLVGSLMLLYDLHPEDCAVRIERALDEVRPYLVSHKGNVSLSSIQDGVVSLRMHGSCHGCPSSAATLKNMIEEAVFAAAPEIASIELVNEDAAPSSAPGAGFVPIAALTPAADKAQV